MLPALITFMAKNGWENVKALVLGLVKYLGAEIYK